MNRVESWLRSLGVAGVLGLGVLFACVPFYFSALHSAQTELAARRAAADRLKNREPVRPVSADPRAEELQRFYALFPPLQKLTDELEGVYTLAREAKLDLMQGEYRLEQQGAGPARYQLVLPVRGTYSQVRAFVAAVLKEKPTASVDALRFERKNVAENQIDAQVRITLYFRPHDETETRGTP